MSEGDTIHHAAARIGSLLAGRVPDQIVTPHPRLAGEHWPQRLAGRAVRSVDAYGKHLFLRFEGELTLHSHLRMTGMWGVYHDGERWRRPAHRAWLVLCCQAWQIIEFDGPVLELMTDSQARRDRRIVALGQDVLGESFSQERFLGRLRARGAGGTIGEALLDQHVLAGIGNVWKVETCFAVGIDPWRSVAEVSDEQAISLLSFAREHMRNSAKHGQIMRPRAVYKRAGRPCPRCGSPIHQRRQGDHNRLTFWCPHCQN